MTDLKKKNLQDRVREGWVGCLEYSGLRDGREANGMSGSQQSRIVIVPAEELQLLSKTSPWLALKRRTGLNRGTGE